jgi:L-fucose isomerase-like protein
MTHTAPNEVSLKKILGPRVVPLDLGALLARADEMPEALALAAWQRIKGNTAVEDVRDADGMASLQICAAMKELIVQHGVQAFAVGCYPDLMGSVCLPASLLADEGVPVACEGDVHGAIAMYMLSLLTDGPTHNTDLLDPVDDHSVVFSHCGSGSFSLAERPSDIKLCPVRLMDRGVCAQFPGKPGPVTLVSLAAATSGYQCAILEGEAVSTPMVFRGNPVRVRFDHPVKRVIEWIADEGIPHHWMIGYGRVAPELRAWARVCGPDLRLVEI